MNPMFDIMKPAQVLMDTSRLSRLLANNTDRDDRKYIIAGWIAQQNRNMLHIVTTLEKDTFANIVAMETFPKLTTEEFATLMGALGIVAHTDPELEAIVGKLKTFLPPGFSDPIPSLQTCFDVEGFTGNDIDNIPELADCKCELYLTAQIRVGKVTHATES